MSIHATFFEASAPGSLMLMGEHAVLHGRQALCGALTQRLRVRCTPRKDRSISIQSSLGSYESTLDDLVAEPPFTYLHETILSLRPIRGFDLEVQSDFRSDIGFGSSAAISVAAAAAIQAAEEKPFDRAAIFDTAFRAVRSVQGRASGADVAAATFGGIVLYTSEPLSIDPIRRSLPLSAIYCGYKTPTPVVIEKVEGLRQQHPTLFEALFNTMDRCVTEAAAALRSGDLEQLGRLFRIHQGLQKAMGTEDETLSRILSSLNARPGVFGSKISGSGLGDCVIALGEDEVTLPDFDSYPVSIDLEGVSLEP